MTFIAFLLVIGISTCIIMKYFWGEDEIEKEHDEAVRFRKESKKDEEDKDR